jgi:hypothetical protein
MEKNERQLFWIKYLKGSIIFFFIAFLSNSSYAQTSKLIEEKVKAFFLDFEKKDTSALRNYFRFEPRLQSAFINKKGESILSDESLSDFLIGIASIPDSVKFEERITKVTVLEDGNLAIAYCQYEFYLNQSLSHIGVDVFTFFNDLKDWKIIQLCDTRRQKK